MTSPLQTHPARSRWWRAGFGGTLAAAMAAGTFSQFALGVLAPFILVDLDLSRSRLGMLTTVLFLVGGIASPVLGRLTDTLGARRLTVAQFAVSAVALALLGAAPGYALLLVAVGLSGLGMAAANPTTNKLVAVHAALGRRGLLMGVKQSGVQVGAFVAGAALPAGAAVLGWRGVLVAAGVVTLIGVAATLLLVPPDPPSRAGLPRRERAPLPALVPPLFAYALLMGAGLACVQAYLPLFAVERMALSASRAGLVAGVVGAVGVAARIGWARVAERHTATGTTLVLLGVGAVVAMALLLVAPAAGAPILWGAAVVLGASAAAWNSVGMLALVDGTGDADAGRASGVVLLGFYAGFVLSPVAFGAWVDATGDYGRAWTGVLLLFAAAAAVAGRWRHGGEPAAQGREPVG